MLLLLHRPAMIGRVRFTAGVVVLIVSVRVIVVVWTVGPTVRVPLPCGIGVCSWFFAQFSVGVDVKFDGFSLCL